MGTATSTMICTQLLAMGGDLRSRLLLIGALIAVIVGLMLATWLLIGRRHARRRKRQPQRWHLPPDPAQAGQHTHRHRHRKERHMNPTLADTGGLPQRRPDDPSTNSDHPPGMN